MHARAHSEKITQSTTSLRETCGFDLMQCVDPDVPSPPGQAQILDTQSRQVTVTWTPSYTDNNSPISNYNIQIRYGLALNRGYSGSNSRCMLTKSCASYGQNMQQIHVSKHLLLFVQCLWVKAQHWLRVWKMGSKHIKRFRRMLFLATKHHMQILGVGPFCKLQNNT